MLLDIVKPVEHDLDDLFGLRLRIVPGNNGVATTATKAKDIAIGCPQVDFVFQGYDVIDGVLLIWPKKTEWWRADDMCVLFANDTLHLTLNWEKF